MFSALASWTKSVHVSEMSPGLDEFLLPLLCMFCLVYCTDGYILSEKARCISLLYHELANSLVKVLMDKMFR